MMPRPRLRGFAGEAAIDRLGADEARDKMIEMSDASSVSPTR